jgi:hypothetical protein
MSMKNALITFIVTAFACSGSLMAQQNTRVFGDVTPSDFKTTYNDSAEAIIIFNVGKTVLDAFSETGTTYKRHIRYRILKKSALSRWGGNFSFLVSKGTLSRPEGVTYNLENGKVVRTELSESGVFKKKASKYEDEVAIAFPNVKVGSIIELQYTIQESGLYLYGFEFQNDIPTVLSEYSIHSSDEDYVTNFTGEIKPTTYETKYNGKYQYWLLKDIPAFNAEPLMPDQKVFASSVFFGASYKTWEELYVSLKKTKGFWGRLDYQFFLKERINELTAGRVDSIEMIKAISKDVKDRIKFNGTFDWLADDLKEIEARKEGSAGDINIFLAAMLKKAGFKVNMVILSTRGNGFLMEKFISLHQFDYVICEVLVNNKALLLDATEKYLPFDMLPEECLNHKGFLIGDKQLGWIPVEPTQRHRINVDARIEIEDDGSLNCNVKYLRSAYSAFRSRKQIEELGEEKYLSSMFQDKQWTISERKVENATDIEKPFVESFQLHIPEHAILSANNIYLNPHLFLREEENPFRSEERKYPVDYGKLTDHNTIVNIIIPEGFEIEQMPENKVFALPEAGGRCSFNFALEGNKLTIATRLLINKTLFQPYEYPTLREFYARVVAKKAETIVRRKRL